MPVKFFQLAFFLVLSGCTVLTPSVDYSPDQRTLGTVVEDQAIELKANKELSLDADIRENGHINVTSYHNVVLVSGEVPTEALKQRTIQIVRDIPKVKKVYDELTIAAPSSLISRSSDSVLSGKVKSKLLLLKNFNANRVKVVTEKGVVYLMGLISRVNADRVTEETRQTSGVQKVVKLFEYTD